MNGTVKTFGERKAHCKGTKAEQAEKIVKRAAAVIASQEGLDRKHGIDSQACGEIFTKIYSEVAALFAQKRDLYPFPKV